MKVIGENAFEMNEKLKLVMEKLTKGMAFFSSKEFDLHFTLEPL